MANKHYLVIEVDAPTDFDGAEVIRHIDGFLAIGLLCATDAKTLCEDPAHAYDAERASQLTVISVDSGGAIQ